MNRHSVGQQLRHGGGLAPAVVMNMFYTGLGIARSLGTRGVPVIGLTARRGVYGNFTRYARTLTSPDSRTDPEGLLAFLLRLGGELGRPAVIFPTRDDDVVFLNRFRAELAGAFRVVVPPASAAEVCLSKWRTYQAALEAGVAAPRCWAIEAEGDLVRVLDEVEYPCVLKPVAAHHWRQGRNWDLVGARKAIAIGSQAELVSEYRAVARADRRAIVQELIPGADDCLVIAACYLDRQSRWVAGFNTQKLVQVPERFGTGCIVQCVDRPELFEPAARLLQKIGFSGIAEVEFKWDAAARMYKLIEVNPRPWDQHRLGYACGADLIYLAYCDHAGVAMPAVRAKADGRKWIADDTFIASVLQMAWHRDSRLRELFRQARGRRIYAIWSARDPLPFMAYLLRGLIPELIGAGIQAIRNMLRTRFVRKKPLAEENVVYESSFEK